MSLGLSCGRFGFEEFVQQVIEESDDTERESVDGAPNAFLTGRRPDASWTRRSAALVDAGRSEVGIAVAQSPPSTTLPPLRPSCFDQIETQGETQTDCGGPNCPLCPGTCFDEVVSLGETRIDCGGDCEPCSAATTACTAKTLDGTRYEFCDAKVSWNTAHIDCLERNMRLAQIGSANEDAWLKENAVYSGTNWQLFNAWVAGSDQVAEGDWVWGIEASFWSGGNSGFSVADQYDNWALGEPNNAGAGEDCLGISLRPFEPPSWNDSPCDEVLWYICEQGGG